MSEIQFLSLNQVLELHRAAIEAHGGDAGIKDLGLVESAVAMPRQRFEGAPLHPDLPAMAAAYLYHLAKAHAFVDGNKRVGAMAALVFLDANDAPKLPPARDMERITMAVSAGTMDKQQVTAWFYEQLTPEP